jgi:hypothetical protein
MPGHWLVPLPDTPVHGQAAGLFYNGRLCIVFVMVMI